MLKSIYQQEEPREANQLMVLQAGDQGGEIISSMGKELSKALPI